MQANSDKPVTTLSEGLDMLASMAGEAMPVEREDSMTGAIPAWPADQLDSVVPPEPAAPYFDEKLNAWVLSRHADILAAFRASSLFPASSNSSKPAEPMPPCDHLKMRAETIDALPASRIGAWRELLLPLAEAQAAGLPSLEPVELLEAYARPLCLSLAATVTGISLDLSRQLYEAAAQVSAAAAEPFDPEIHQIADLASEELKPHFHVGPESLRDSTFVALSQTMPCILGNAWYALTQHPRAWELLHNRPGLIDHAVEELLRYAGLVRILGRMAQEDIDLNGTTIGKGQRIILRIIAGNRDPERFSDPNQVEIARRDGGHLSLGAGGHACVGANLIRMAAATITLPLVRRFALATPAQLVEWRGGSGFRSPAVLWVSLS
jgi:cytochrome P450